MKKCNCDGVKITVVIPTFNRQALTDRAVRSVFEQTRLPEEIIVVDDGSPIPYRNMDHWVRIIRHTSNRGAAAARNSGIRAASGDFIAFLDSDDIWFPEKLARQCDVIDRLAPGISALTCGFCYCDPINTRETLVLPTPCDSLEIFAGGCLFNPGTTLIVAKIIFRKIGLFREDLCRLEDYEWFLRFAMAGGRLESTAEVLAQVNKGPRPNPKVMSKAIKSLARITDRLSIPAAARAKGYLSLEQACAHWYARDFVRFAWHFGASLLRAPRCGIHLNRQKPCLALPPGRTCGGE